MRQPPRSLYKRRIKDCELIEGEKRLYSPALSNAWDDVNHPKAEEGDWFRDWDCMKYITKHAVKTDGEIFDANCQTLESIELAILTKSALHWKDKFKS